MKSNRATWFLRAFLIVFVPGSLFAQKSPDLTSLTTPAAPAYTILGIQPNEISRPKSWNALEASLYSSFTDGAGLILPKNYALEFTPYWMQSHPTLTFKQYADPGPWQSILQTLSVSLATSLEENTADTSFQATRLGAGVRFTLFSGRAPAENAEIIGKAVLLKEKLSGLNGILSLLESTVEKQPGDLQMFRAAFNDRFARMIENDVAGKHDMIFIKESLVDPYLSAHQAETTEEVASLIGQLKTKFDSLVQSPDLDRSITEVQQMAKEHWGFMLDVSGAFELDFPTSSIGWSEIPKWGFWFIPSYRMKNLKFDFLGIVRYLRNEIPAEPTDNIDAGGKLVFQSRKFSLALEGMARYQWILLSKTVENGVTTTQTKSDADWRLVLNFDYSINEKLSVSCNFGKNFSKNTGLEGDLIASVGLNFGIGGPKLDVFGR
jgi:hypothetical protein